MMSRYAGEEGRQRDKSGGLAGRHGRAGTARHRGRVNLGSIEG
jgi:hypothetical protein